MAPPFRAPLPLVFPQWMRAELMHVGLLQTPAANAMQSKENACSAPVVGGGHEYLWTCDSEIPSFSNAGLEGVPMRKEGEALE